MSDDTSDKSCWYCRHAVICKVYYELDRLIHTAELTSVIDVWSNRRRIAAAFARGCDHFESTFVDDEK